MSAANDEGITALHNAICAGHVSVAEYLVNYGCDVNAPDNDGWLVSFQLSFLSFTHSFGCHCDRTKVTVIWAPQLGGLRERCELPQRGRAPAASDFLYIIYQKNG